MDRSKGWPKRGRFAFWRAYSADGAEGHTHQQEEEMEHLTKDTFLKKVFDYEKNQEWQFNGELPAIVDFYADWCGPCRMVAPVLEELGKEFEGQIDIYKVDTEKEQELAAVFGIRSIPSILFIPKEGKPQMAMGALPKESFVQAIADILKVQKPVLN
ncbi:MAG TPA: thioredoxin [Bacteroidota bacterium]|nr:thioredoxin [Bacteroidota bacterium]